MKLRLTAAVEGMLDVPRPSSEVTAVRAPYTFVLKSDAAKRVSTASVEVGIPGDKVAQARSLITHPPEGDRLDVHFDQELYRSMIEQLQILESNISFGFITNVVQQIRWDEPTIDLIPENAEEEAVVNAWGIHFKKEYIRIPGLTNDAQFAEMIQNAQKYDSLAVVKAFFREGKNEFCRLRYVQAFYNFYFVIEGMFANGHFRERDVLRAFGDSAEMRTATEITLNSFKKDPQQWARLRGRLVSEKLEVNDEGLRRFLVQIRGRLHHYYSKSSLKHGTPFSNDDFETPGLIAMMLARQCIMVRIITINGGSLMPPSA